jgi:hypothetical protein
VAMDLTKANNLKLIQAFFTLIFKDQIKTGYTYSILNYKTVKIWSRRNENVRLILILQYEANSTS